MHSIEKDTLGGSGVKERIVPLISVIIPVYNAADYLDVCISSLQKEGTNEIEIICVDDGSTDESISILERFALQDQRIQIFRQHHQSAGAARNKGLSVATGMFVHFLDADDWISPGIYEKSIKYLYEHGADVCFFQYFGYNHLTKHSKKRACLLNRNDEVTTFQKEPAFFIYNMVAPWNKIYRRAWLKHNSLFFDEVVCGNDRGFYFRMLAAEGKFVLCKDYGVYYREKNPQSLTGECRYFHLDSLFYVWQISEAALVNESPVVQAMLLDCMMKDILYVFERTPHQKKKYVLETLRKHLKQVDFTVIEGLPVPCIWRKDVEQIIYGNYDNYQLRSRWTDIPKRILTSWRIWGIKGCIIKHLFSR